METKRENAYAGLPADSLAEAVNRFMIGGNGVASGLISAFREAPNSDHMHDWHYWRDNPRDEVWAHAEHECMRLLGKEQWYLAYELWQMWYTCMDVRRTLLGEPELSGDIA